MAGLDKILDEALPPVRRGTCKVGDFLHSLDADDRHALSARLADRAAYSSVALAAGLKRSELPGSQMAAATIDRHRKRACACE